MTLGEFRRQTAHLADEVPLDVDVTVIDLEGLAWSVTDTSVDLAL